MKPYKGIIRLECGKGKKLCPRKLINDMDSECIACMFHLSRILDLNGDVVFAIEPQAKPKKTKKKKD